MLKKRAFLKDNMKPIECDSKNEVTRHLTTIIRHSIRKHGDNIQSGRHNVKLFKNCPLNRSKSNLGIDFKDK